MWAGGREKNKGTEGGVAPQGEAPGCEQASEPFPFLLPLLQSYQNRQAHVAGAAGGQQEDEDSSDSEAADSPSSDERRIIETPPHRY